MWLVKAVTGVPNSHEVIQRVRPALARRAGRVGVSPARAPLSRLSRLRALSLWLLISGNDTRFFILRYNFTPQALTASRATPNSLAISPGSWAYGTVLGLVIRDRGGCQHVLKGSSSTFQQPPPPRLWW